jgi:hypothetical protein
MGLLAFFLLLAIPLVIVCELSDRATSRRGRKR